MTTTITTRKTTSPRRVLGRILLTFSLLAAAASAQTEDGNLPPPFFLQDPNDSLCLSGEEFKRCSIDTLWYATGTHGDYKIHKRPLSGEVDETDDGFCLAKKSCKESDKSKTLPAKVAKCSACGAKGWNILGENESGYTLMNDQGSTCLSRVPSSPSDGGGTVHDKAVTSPCSNPDTPLTTLQLQFASAADIATMSSPGARLVSAATDGDKKTVQAILKEGGDDGGGVDINVSDWDGLNALIPAASNGHLDLCKFLIKEGIDVNAADKDGITALMEASIMGHVKVVEYLLQQGAQVEQTATSGINAVWLAASEGQLEVVKLLLDKGADMTNTRADDISVLMVAAIGGHVDMVTFLLAQGADPTAIDKDGLTPLMNAVERGDFEVVKAIVEALPDDKIEEHVNKYSAGGFTPLIIASAHGSLESARFLIEKGAEISKGCTTGNVTPLMYASSSKHPEIVKMLIEKGADVNQKHDSGGTALLEAATGGSVEAVKILIEAGADISVQDEDGVSAIMGIATSCPFDTFQYLWNLYEEQGLADGEINRMSNSGGTPVMFAAAGGNVECIDFLIKRGATIDVRSKATPEYLEKLRKHHEAMGTTNELEKHTDDVTPLHVAAQSGHLEAVERFLEAGSDPTLIDAEGRTALLVAIKGNYGELAIALVRGGSDPNTPYVDEEGNEHNLLFDAIMVENEEFAKVLIEKGANLYHQDDKKVTTLLQASHRGLTDIVQMLVDAHASRGNSGSFLDDPSDEGVTPLISASSEGHDEVVKILLKAGAKVTEVDGDGVTPLMAAAARGHLGIVKLLVGEGVSVNAQNKDGHSALMFAYNGKNQVQTLMERFSEYYADEGAAPENADETETLVKEALANHTALVDFLLASGADNSLKDKEGHVAKDFDYQADNPAVFGKDATSSGTPDSAKEEL